LLLGAAWLVSAIDKEGVDEKGDHADNGEDLTREQQCFNALTPVILASPRNPLLHERICFIERDR